MSGDTANKDDNTKTQLKQISYHDIATKLLNDKLLLTALELYTELVEAGKDLHILRDYFSNPGHFEHQTQEVPRISRSGSQATLDSLDLTRFSEDGERSTDERVAILEFELRKARESISALRNNLTVATTESETNTPDKKVPGSQNNNDIMPHEQRALNFLINEYLLLNGYKLTSITFADENENQDFEDWDDVGLNIPKPAELLTLYRNGLKQTVQNNVNNSTQTDDTISKNPALAEEVDVLNLKIDELNQQVHYLQNENKKIIQNISISSSNGNSPEHFEIIDSNTDHDKKLDSLVIVDDNISNNSLNEVEWTSFTLHAAPQSISDEAKEKKEALDKPDDCDSNTYRQLPQRFKKHLLTLCLPATTMNAEKQIFENISSMSLIHVLSQSLLQIIPNIILNKREEVIPLLVNAVYLNPNTAERDKLLQQLFNLKKKPSHEEREVILAGIITIARYSGENVVENEILPQCWEQLTHKHVERRLLVVESCIALIPYVSSPIRNSLMLSMLQQMLEDREEIVRQTVIQALSLVVALCDDVDKYGQCEELALRTINDSSDLVVNISIEILFPVIAQWALSIGRLHSDLIKQLLYKLNKNLKDSQMESQNNTETIIRIIAALSHLLPFIALFVADIDKIVDNIEKDMTIDLSLDILKLCTDLTNPSNFYNGNFSVGMIFYEFDKYIIENPADTWPQLDWFLDIVIPDLINNLGHVEVSHRVILQSIMDLQLHICILFGKNFTHIKIYPLYQVHIQNLEQILSSFNQYLPNLSIIPVYLVSVLSCCNDLEELGSILKRFTCALPLCGTPLDCLEITVEGLCKRNQQELVVNCLWEGVVHQRPLVRASTAGLLTTVIPFCNEALLTSKVTPALVTLANDSDALVRTATIPALGNLIRDSSVSEVHDKVYMQLQSFLSDPSTRDNHALLRQLVVTLGNIVGSCKTSFKDEVIVTELSSLSLFTSQMTNTTRKVDMALALLEAFPNIIYSPLNRHVISSTLLPGLRCLELVIMENPSLFPHKDSIISMVRETENRISVLSPQSPTDRSSSSTLSHNVNLGVEDMKQRVSKIFQIPNTSKQNTLPNLQGIFKKK